MTGYDFLTGLAAILFPTAFCWVIGGPVAAAIAFAVAAWYYS